VFRVVELVVLVLAALFLVPVIFWPFVERFIDPVMVALVRGGRVWRVLRSGRVAFAAMTEDIARGVVLVVMMLVALWEPVEDVARRLTRELRGFTVARSVEETPLWERFTVETPGLTGWTDWIGFEQHLEFELGLRRPWPSCCRDLRDGRCPACGRVAGPERVVLTAEPVTIEKPMAPMLRSTDELVRSVADTAAATDSIVRATQAFRDPARAAIE
jgi:hypothetical protein